MGMNPEFKVMDDNEIRNEKLFELNIIILKL